MSGVSEYIKPPALARIDDPLRRMHRRRPLQLIEQVVRKTCYFIALKRVSMGPIQLQQERKAYFGSSPQCAKGVRSSVTRRSIKAMSSRPGRRNWATDPSLDMPRDDHLRRGDPKLIGDFLHLWNLQRLLDLVIASQGRVRLDQEIVLLRPLSDFN